MTKFSPAATEAWDKATKPHVMPSCATCIHSSVARSAMPCDRCNDFDQHEPRHVIDRADRAYGGMHVLFEPVGEFA